jgi:hypothetical protein
MKAFFREIEKALKNPREFAYFAMRHHWLNFLPDMMYIKLQYRLRTRKKLNLKYPKTYNEKLQWIKLYDRNPIYTQLADKYEVRKFISDVIGEQYLVPLLGVWDKVEDINFDELPGKFVLKCNHDSGSAFICKDKATMYIKNVRKRLNKRLRKNHFWYGREWPYKGIKPKIIAEKYLEDKSGALEDYKVHCFNGTPKIIQVDIDRFTSHKRNIYTNKWEYLNVSIKFPTSDDYVIKVTDAIRSMLDLSEIIAAKVGAANLRIDWYCPDDVLYFGELTFTHGNGAEAITPAEFAEHMGSWINLPMRKD